MAKKKTKRAREGYKRPLRFLWGFFILGILTVFLLFGGAALGLYGPMPDLQQLENPKTNLASQIISSDGAVLGKYYFDDNRTPIGFDEIPTNMVEALIATEDERFMNIRELIGGEPCALLFFWGNAGEQVPFHNSWHGKSL